MGDFLYLLWCEIASRILLAVLGVIFIFLGLISPDIAYDTMKKAVEKY